MTVTFNEMRLVNDYGSDYGQEVTVFADTYQEGYQALVKRYGEEELNGCHDVWDQFIWSVETPETRAALEAAEKAAFPEEAARP